MAPLLWRNRLMVLTAIVNRIVLCLRFVRRQFGRRFHCRCPCPSIYQMHLRTDCRQTARNFIRFYYNFRVLIMRVSHSAIRTESWALVRFDDGYWGGVCGGSVETRFLVASDCAAAVSDSILFRSRFSSSLSKYWLSCFRRTCRVSISIPSLSNLIFTFWKISWKIVFQSRATLILMLNTYRMLVYSICKLLDAVGEIDI